jgi:hypothetical protein
MEFLKKCSLCMGSLLDSRFVFTVFESIHWRFPFERVLNRPKEDKKMFTILGLSS